MLNYPEGSIVYLTNHDKRHCGVVIDHKHTVELIACKDENLQKVICKLILLSPDENFEHPVTGKEPLYELWKYPVHSWTTKELKQRVKQLKPKYDGKDYHIIKNNCQHFAWELTTGERKSPDADKFALVGGAIGLAFHIKDFGSTSSLSNFSVVKSLQEKLDYYCLT
jgi:hypothetical protein